MQVIRQDHETSLPRIVADFPILRGNGTNRRPWTASCPALQRRGRKRAAIFQTEFREDLRFGSKPNEARNQSAGSHRGGHKLSPNVAGGRGFRICRGRVDDE